MRKEKGMLLSVEDSDLALLDEKPKEFWKDVTSIGSFAFYYRLLL